MNNFIDLVRRPRSYHAQEDAPRVGTLTHSVPPDIHAAVGLTHSMSVTNNNYRV